jgi:hypothetical protein
MLCRTVRINESRAKSQSRCVVSYNKTQSNSIPNTERVNLVRSAVQKEVDFLIP